MKNIKIITTILILFCLSCSDTVTGPDFGPERNIVFRKDGNLFITNSEGTGVKQLTFTANHRAPSWSPDGTKIAFTSDQLGNGFDIFAINIDGSNMTRLTSESTDDLPNLKWSPDGSKIAYTLMENIYMINSDGSNLKEITTEAVDFNFSPDGSRIVYFGRYIDIDLNYFVSDMYIMNSDGTNKTLIATGERNEFPVFSPDGSKIAFVRSSGAEGFGHFISIMNVDGTDKTRLTFDDSISSFPTFSPDGSKIVFVSYRAGSFSELYTMITDGTNQTRLTHTGSLLSGDGISSNFPKWSPDSEYIVYNENEFVLFETVKTTLKIIRSDGSQQISLASINSSGPIRFSFSPVW